MVDGRQNSHGRGHEVLQEAEVHSSYSATDNIVVTAAAAAATAAADDMTCSSADQ